MLGMPRHSRAAVVLGLAVLGCPSSGIDAAAHGYTVVAAEAFQVEEDEHLSGPVSPLTAVEGYYLAAGESITVRAGDPAKEPAGARPSDFAEVEVGASGSIEVRHFVGGEVVEQITGACQVDLGSRVVVVSEQSGRARVIVHDPAATARTAFARRPWFPVDAKAIVTAKRRAGDQTKSVKLRTSRGLDKAMPVAGVLEGRVHGTPFSLTAFGSPTGDWLVPFNDPSNGETSYPAGRYLTVLPDAREGDDVVLDFNRAVNPWCAYSDLYNCPMPPAGNDVAVSLAAGERMGAAH